MVSPVESLPCRRQRAVDHLPGSAGSPGAAARWAGGGPAPGEEGEGLQAAGQGSAGLDAGRALGVRRAS